MDKANIQQTTGLQVFYNENENVNVRTQVIECHMVKPYT